MTIDRSKLVSKIIQDRALPDYVKSEYPEFVAFLDAYLDYMEEEKQPLDIANNLRDYRNIDETLDEFIDNFRKETMVNIPSEILADKRLLAKQIKEFYLNKGNESSYRFLFRVLYNEDIEFYYPKVDVLRASDGKWYEQKSIKITLTNPENILFFTSRQVVGATSGTTAIIEYALNFEDRGQSIVELSLSNIRGSFETGETVTVSYTDENGFEQTISETILEIFTDVDITESGSGYSIDELFIIRNSDDEEIGKGVVTQVSKGPVVSLVIDEGGKNYNGNIQEVTKFYALPIDYTLNNDDLLNTIIDGSGSGSSGTDYSLYEIDETIPLQEIAGTGDTIIINDSNTSFGSGAFGVVETTGNDGELLEVTLLATGDDYQAPEAVIQSTTGSLGEIDVVGGGGAIADVALISFPLSLGADLDSNDDFTVYPDFTNGGDQNAEGNMTIGTLAEYPGRYLNEDGHLSSGKRLQDNFFYQDYSYVLKVGIAIEKWRDIIKKIIHPSGLIVFGEIEFFAEFDSTISFSETKLERELIIEIGEHEATMDEAVLKLFEDDSNGTPQPILDSNGNHLIDYLKDSNGDYVQT